MIYQDLFKNWSDVQREYDMNEPYPDEVLIAFYGYESYTGVSIVIYRNKEKYYLVESGHCSCNGLEGTWRPEEYSTKDLFLACLKKRTDYAETKKIIQDIILKLENEG